MRPAPAPTSLIAAALRRGRRGCRRRNLQCKAVPRAEAGGGNCSTSSNARETSRANQSRSCRVVKSIMVMTKEEIRTEARIPASPPIKGDGGGSVRSTASSCPASPPRNEATATCKTVSAGGKANCRWEPRTTCWTINARTTATNAATMANHTWLVSTLANTRPAKAPPNAPITTIPRTLADAKPLMRDNVISRCAGLNLLGNI